MMRLALSLLFLFCLLPQYLTAQDQEPEVKIADALDRMLNEHPHRWAIFWIQPQLRIGSGYDSNALYRTSQEIGDYFVSVAPEGSIGLRFGSRAFLVVDENLNFLYYNNLEQRRDIFNTTRARFTTGSRKTLFTLRGSYASKKDVIDSEFDIPGQQKRTTGGADLEISVAPKFDLGVRFNVSQNLYAQDPEIVSLYPPPPDNTIFNYGGSLDYKIRPQIFVSFDGGVSRTEFLDTDRYRNSVRTSAGLRFATDPIRGQIRFGYVQTDTSQVRDTKLRSLLIDAGLSFLIRGRTKVSTFVTRNHEVSRLGEGNFRITTQGGVAVDMPLGPKIGVDGSFRIGKNDYGRAGLAPQDNFQNVGGGFNYFLVRNLALRGGLTYYRRESNFSIVVKDRVTYDVGIRYVLTPE